MQIDPAEQRRLLDLAATDKSINALQHRRKSLPELQVIATADERLRVADGRVVELQTARADLGREMARLESDIDSVRSRADRNRQRQESGAISSSKDLESLQHEIATLQRRQGSLEDQELELMEQAEQLDSDIASAIEARAAIESERAEAESSRDEQWAELDRKGVDLAADRTDIAGGIDEDLLAMYDKIRTTGVPGAALLTQRRCGACRIEFAGSQLATVRAAAPEDVVRCEACRSILVRTGESGL